MTPETLFGISAVPAIVGLVEACKRIGLPSRAAPLAAVVFGILAALGQLYYTKWPWVPSIAAGIALGLSAAGLYAGSKAVFSSSSSDVPLIVGKDIPWPDPADPPLPARPSPVRQAPPFRVGGAAVKLEASNPSTTEPSPSYGIGAPLPDERTNG